MATKIYGCSDDLIEFEGDFNGEVVCCNTDGEHPALVVLSDGTLLKVYYGKNGKAIWGISLLRRGTLFKYINPCIDEDEESYSDIAYFKDGIKWAYAANGWQEVE